MHKYVIKKKNGFIQIKQIEIHGKEEDGFNKNKNIYTKSSSASSFLTLFYLLS